MSVIMSSLRRTESWHRPLMVFTVLMAALTLAAAVGIATDPRILGGAPIWLKPFKFAVSFVVYAGTMAWIISRLPHRRRWAGAAGLVIVATAVIEMVIIVGQAARGTFSHFNVTTALDTALWSAMGSSIVVLWLATLVIAVFATRGSFGDRPFTLAVRLGLAVSLVGMALGFLMTAPTAEQTQALAEGAPTMVGAHSVGVPDGGPGMPVTAWSLTGGDVRVSHFVGIHALQALPLLAWLLTRPSLGLPERARSQLVLTGAAGYLGLTAALAWQALRGQPVTAPDGLTLAVLALLVVAMAGAVAVVVLIARRSAPGSEVAR